MKSKSKSLADRLTNVFSNHNKSIITNEDIKDPESSVLKLRSHDHG